MNISSLHHVIPEESPVASSTNSQDSRHNKVRSRPYRSEDDSDAHCMKKVLDRMDFLLLQESSDALRQSGFSLLRREAKNVQRRKKEIKKNSHSSLSDLDSIQSCIDDKSNRNPQNLNDSMKQRSDQENDGNDTIVENRIYQLKERASIRKHAKRVQRMSLLLRRMELMQSLLLFDMKKMLHDNDNIRTERQYSKQKQIISSQSTVARARTKTSSEQQR
jgi:hypothetical protein